MTSIIVTPSTRILAKDAEPFCGTCIAEPLSDLSGDLVNLENFVGELIWHPDPSVQILNSGLPRKFVNYLLRAVVL